MKLIEESESSLAHKKIFLKLKISLSRITTLFTFHLSIHGSDCTTHSFRAKVAKNRSPAIKLKVEEGMKIASTVALSFLASASAVREHAPALRSANNAVGDEFDRYTGSVEIPELSNESEREAFMDAACTGIERLLGGTVACECTPEIMSGTLSFDCDSYRDVTLRQNVLYTPSFTGVFSVALLPMDVSFGVGYCLDGFILTIEEAPMPLNLGDICFKGKVRLDADLNTTTPLVTPSLESCTFTAGTFGECEACEPCTTADGQTGFSVTCDFVEVAACVPLAIPVSRNSRRVDTELFGEQIVDGILELAQPEIDRMISEVEAVDDADEPDATLADDADEAIVSQPNEPEVIAAEPTEKESSKEKKPKKADDIDEEELEEDEQEESDEAVAPDWGEPNTVDTGRTSLWNKMWPF